MTDNDRLKLGCITAKWIEAEWQRRALRADRATACVIARKHGIGVDYEDDQSGKCGTYRDDREEMQPLIDRIVDLDEKYLAAAARAGALRAAMNKICTKSGIARAMESESLLNELTALDQIEGNGWSKRQ